MAGGAAASSRWWRTDRASIGQQALGGSPLSTGRLSAKKSSGLKCPRRWSHAGGALFGTWDPLGPVSAGEKSRVGGRLSTG